MPDEYTYPAFPKIPRLNAHCTVTEKIDGTNALIDIFDGRIRFGSRTRWLAPSCDNYGFYSWGVANKEELLKLGDGLHYGEWWGHGIQRGYGLKEKRFSLFNTARWNEETKPACCHVVPVLYEGPFDSSIVSDCRITLALEGSRAAPGFMNPEGVMIYHSGLKAYMKSPFAEHKRK